MTQEITGNTSPRQMNRVYPCQARVLIERLPGQRHTLNWPSTETINQLIADATACGCFQPDQIIAFWFHVVDSITVNGKEHRLVDSVTIACENGLTARDLTHIMYGWLVRHARTHCLHFRLTKRCRFGHTQQSRRGWTSWGMGVEV